MESPHAPEQAPEPHASPLSAFIVKFRYAIAAVGVAGMACVSGMTNIEHGLDASIQAAINQAIHTGISACVIMKIHACVAAHCASRASQILPALIPATISAAACYAIHRLGLPYIREPSAEPILATMPTVIALSIVMPTYHIAYHRQKLANVMNPADTISKLEPQRKRLRVAV